MKARRIPGWWALALTAGLGTLAMRTGPVSDVDVFWHVRVGDILRQHVFFPSKDPWSYTVPDHHWHSTAWLSEIVLWAVQSSGGWYAVIALRFAMTLGFLVGLFLLLLRGTRDRAAAVVYVIAALPVASYIEERPQTASLMFLAWLAAVLRGVVLDGTPPRRWRFVAITYLWACIHGLFILAPGLLIFVGLLRWRRPPPYRAAARGTLVTGVIAFVAAGCTPMGPRLLVAPLTIGSAARGFITEWAPTNIEVFGAFGFFVFLAIILVGSARAEGPRTSRTELAVVLALAVFGMLALRNAGPASILLAPLALAQLRKIWASDSFLELPAVPVLGLSLVAVLAIFASCFSHPAVTDKPTRIAGYLQSVPAGSRVYNEYNVSGYLIYTLGSHIRLVVDGRADRYGPTFLHDYVLAQNGDPSWDKTIRDLDPDFAVISKRSPLIPLLERVRDWTPVMTDQDFVLLKAPT